MFSRKFPFGDSGSSHLKIIGKVLLDFSTDSKRKRSLFMCF